MAAKHPEYASPKPQAVILNEASSKELVLISLADPLHIYGRVRYPDQTALPWNSGDLPLRGGYLCRNLDRSRRPLLTSKSPLQTAPSASFLPKGYLTEVLSDIPVRYGKKARSTPFRYLPESPARDCRNRARPQGKPAPNALVSSLGLIEPVWTITDAEGKFRILLRHLPPKNTNSISASNMPPVFAQRTRSQPAQAPRTSTYPCPL